MDELSWRARLLKSNINIKRIDYDNNTVYFDFAYRPYAGGPQKWGSTIYRTDMDADLEDTAEQIRELVLSLRKKLEG